MKKNLRKLSIIFTLCAVLVSCKDYDDDIKALWAEVNDTTTTTQLSNDLKSLQTSLNDAKADLEKAKTAAADAMKAAQEAGDDAAVASLEATQKANAAKEESIAAAQDEIDALETELMTLISAINTSLGTKASKDDLEKLKKQLDNLEDRMDELAYEIGGLISHRLTSVVLIPTTQLNNEPGIIFKNITYIPQMFQNHTAYTVNGVDAITEDTGKGEVTKDVTGKGRLYLDGKTTELKYLLSPRDVYFTPPSFLCDIQTNYSIPTRGVDNTGRIWVGENSPVMAEVKSYDSATGVLTVIAVKNVINKTGQNITNSENINFVSTDNEQTYYIAGLRVPIAPEFYTQEEIRNGAQPVVTSGYSRIAELVVVPMIKQKAAAAQTAHSGAYNRQQLLNGKNTTGLYVHYHDSVSLYTSSVGQLIDHQPQLGQPFDLKSLVSVCEFETIYMNGTQMSKGIGSHADIAKFKDYGLSFRFYVANSAYTVGDTEPNQQEFAEIANPMNGILTSKSVTAVGGTLSALDREPIVRIELRDTVRNNLVATRYMKVKFK